MTRSVLVELLVLLLVCGSICALIGYGLADVATR